MSGKQGDPLRLADGRPAKVARGVWDDKGGTHVEGDLEAFAWLKARAVRHRSSGPDPIVTRDQVEDARRRLEADGLPAGYDSSARELNVVHGRGCAHGTWPIRRLVRRRVELESLQR